MATVQTKTVYWTLLAEGPWRLFIAATAKGLCYVGSPHAPFEELSAWVGKQIPNHELKENPAKLKPYETELVEFLAGRRSEFTIPLDLRGTVFQLKVWEELMKVPFGQTATYTEL